jgi:hypothetical protein
MSGLLLRASCACGNVEIEAVGPPIVTATCYCDDCQEAARQIEAMPGAAPFRDGDGGTPMVVFRKDRVRCVRGEALLKTLKLREKSPTNRKIATCCNSAMLLDFDKLMHWADIYAARVVGGAPKPEMRMCTKFATHLAPNGPPAFSGYPARLLLKLLKARVEMLFSKPLSPTRT